MQSAPHYDFLIIGAGQAAIPLAEALAKSGKRVALAERRHLGGSCVNFGCIPSKAAIASARLAHDARRASEYGLSIPEVKVDFPAVLARARGISEEARHSLEKKFSPDGNPLLISGHARFESRAADNSFRLSIGDTAVTADQVILDTGTRSLFPPIEGLADIEALHPGNWLHPIELPAHLAVLGAGAIALEMAQFYRRMGSRVTVVSEGNHIALHEDADVASALQVFLEQEGIEFHLGTSVSRIHHQGSEISIRLQNGLSFSATRVFVATGRKPNTDDLGLETIGLTPKTDGIIEVDNRLASNVEGIWIAGDIRGGPQFTHTAWDDYRILESQLIGDRRRTTDRIVPYAIFTDPELGRVGLTEREARAQGRNIKLSRYQMKSNGRAREMGRPEGFIKVLADSATDQIVGAAMLSADAAELVQLFVELMNAGAPINVLRNAIQIHPTLAEAVHSSVSAM